MIARLKPKHPKCSGDQSKALLAGFWHEEHWFNKILDNDIMRQPVSPQRELQVLVFEFQGHHATNTSFSHLSDNCHRKVDFSLSTLARLLGGSVKSKQEARSSPGIHQINNKHLSTTKNRHLHIPRVFFY